MKYFKSTTTILIVLAICFTGGVLGAPNFQFATLGSNANKVITTDNNE